MNIFALHNSDVQETLGSTLYKYQCDNLKSKNFFFIIIKTKDAKIQYNYKTSRCDSVITLLLNTN